MFSVLWPILKSLCSGKTALDNTKEWELFCSNSVYLWKFEFHIHMSWNILLLILHPWFKNVKTILNLWAIQTQVVDRSLLTPTQNNNEVPSIFQERISGKESEHGAVISYFHLYVITHKIMITEIWGLNPDLLSWPVKFNGLRFMKSIPCLKLKGIVVQGSWNNTEL